MLPVVIGVVLGSILVIIILIVICICSCCYIKNKRDHFEGKDVLYLINSVLFNNTNSKNIRLSKESWKQQVLNCYIIIILLMYYSYKQNELRQTTNVNEASDQVCIVISVYVITLYCYYVIHNICDIKKYNICHCCIHCVA